MNTILILGAGRSSAALIQYLLRHAPAHNWKILIGDLSEAAARERIGESIHGIFMPFDIHDEEGSKTAIEEADIVISLLPATLHPLVAKKCLLSNKHLFTASYVGDEMAEYARPTVERGLLFLNECGLDPGIDHMSAMKVIDRIRNKGGNIQLFESFTGGLIAPETDPGNPWRYKFTWNPRNVVTAGQSTAKYLHNGKFRYIPYQQLFRRVTPVAMSGYGSFEGYANRDSLKYITTYGLDGIGTMLRGTLRYPGFCAAWDVFVQLGCCDDTYFMDDVESMTHVDFLNSFLGGPGDNVADKLAAQLRLPDKTILQKLAWSGFFENELVGLEKGTPAQILEHILNKKWRLLPDDRDMIVMQHLFRYEHEGVYKTITASLVAKGDNATYTAMAKTVGLPLAIATRLFLTGKLKARGVVIPTLPEFYLPILKELGDHGILLEEEEFEE